MILDEYNYHTLDNRYLTNSRIKDFLKCKSYFKGRHITGEIKPKGKDAFRVGSAVDTWLTISKDEFLRKFVAVTRRNIKNPPTDYTELTMAQYEEVVNMCEVLEVQPAYLELADHNAQKIISTDLEIGKHFVGLAGIPDWIKIEGDTCIITDLKTAQDANERKYHYRCMDYGYYMQFAVMTFILRRTNPEIKKFIYRHLVIEKDTDGINLPYTFYLDNDRVEVHINVLKNDILPMISSEALFNKKQVKWETAQTIGSIEDEF